MHLIRLIAVGLMLAFTGTIFSKDFNEVFSDSTLRVDYIFGGGPSGVNIFLDSQTKLPGWAGRRMRLDSIPLQGNGRISVLDPISGEVLYANPFSTLFQEWINTPEASTISKSFENSFLLPLPKMEAEIRVTLLNNRHETVAEMNHRYRPDDELIQLRGLTTLPYKYLHKGGSSEKAIDVAILAEGYRKEELDSFLIHAKSMTNEILRYEPFASNSDKFNFIAVMSPSNQSGTSIPLDSDWRDTALESHFSTFYSSRYLTTPRVRKMHSLLEGIPYEYVLILVNSPIYGGGGIFNSYQIGTAKNQLTLPVFVHEFGHSFAGLADEYFYDEDGDETYPLDIEPWEPNITTLVDFDSKWKDMLSPQDQIPSPDADKKGIGVFEGGGYKTFGIFRPQVNCRMRDNYNPDFCPVCQRAIKRIIDFYAE